MLFGATGTMERNERVHIGKGTRIYAFGYGMNEQEFVVYDDNMNAVEICNGDPAAIDEYDLDRYFSPKHHLDETTRPISKKFGIGFYYDESNEVISDEVIQKSLQRAENIARLEQEVKERKARVADEQRAMLIKNYNYLQPCTDKYDHKICGANIRTELKRHFPRVKFSVRYESFSGGDAFRVSWTDGPTARQVDAVVKKYADMHPDSYSMGDFWDCEPSIFNNLYGSVGYVTTSRIISEEAVTRVMDEQGCDRDAARGYIYKTDMTTKTEEKTASATAVSADGLTLIDYSEKAVVLVGETRTIKDTLKSMGGRFNARLSCGAGWVFPKSKRESLEALIG